MKSSLPPLPTVGAIAKRLGVPANQVDRIVRDLSIAPVARAGNARVFSLDAGEVIRKEIASQKGGIRMIAPASLTGRAITCPTRRSRATRSMGWWP